MTSSRKLYLVEQDDAALNYDGALVIAMTPEACCALKNRGVSYKIMRDFYQEDEIRGDQDEIFSEELAWTQQWDLWLRKNVPELDKLNLNIAHLHFSKFKFLIDTFMIHAREVRVLLKKTGTPSEIIYVEKVPRKPPMFSIENLIACFKYSYLELLKTIAKLENIPFSHHELAETAGPKAAPLAKAGVLKSLRGIAKKANHFVRYEKWRRGPAGHKILFLDAGVLAIDEAIKNCVRKGMTVYFKQGLEILDYSSPFMPLKAKLEPRPVLPETIDKLKALALETAGAGWQWEFIRARFGYDYRNIFAAYFEDFLLQTVPRVMSEYQTVADFCKKENIRFIAARGSNGKNYPSALSAAKNLPGVSSVCFQHSSGPLYWQDRIMGELDYFDYAGAMEPVSEQAFTEISAKGGLGNAKVFQAPYYFRILSKNAKPPAPVQGRKPILLYVPRKRSLYRVKFNSYIYPLTWFYELQKKMLAFLATRTDYEIYYKHSETSSWAENSLLKDFPAEKYPNLHITTGRLKDFFPKVDRVLIDHASTAMYEAAASGLPFLALYHTTNGLMHPNAQFFGKSLAPFTEMDDILVKSKEFLDSDGTEYRRSFQFADYDPVDKLLELAGEKS